jgi:hypothetical protein
MERFRPLCAVGFDESKVFCHELGGSGDGAVIGWMEAVSGGAAKDGSGLARARAG